MANALTAFNPELWRPTMQKTFFKESTALGVASVDLRAELAVGDTLHQPYGSYARVQSYTKGTDITVKDVDSTDDTLTVSTAKVASFYVDDIDRIQNKYDAISNFASGAQRQLNNYLDQVVLAEYASARTTLDDGDLGGTDGNGVVHQASNTASIFTAMGRVLNSKKRLSQDRFVMIGPRMLEVVQNYVGNRETGFGDTVADNGKVARRFGFDLVLSNNLPWTGSLKIATQPTDGDTVVINGVTLTFKTTLTGAATLGEVLIGATASTARTNLKKALLDEGTVDTHYSALTSDNRQLLEEAGLTTGGTGSVTIVSNDINFVMFGDVVVSETLTAAADVWSAQVQYSLSGVRGSIAIVTQKSPTVVFRDAQLRLGKYVHPWMLYGVKTFERMKDQLVATKFDVSAWV